MVDHRSINARHNTNNLCVFVVATLIYGTRIPCGRKNFRREFSMVKKRKVSARISAISLAIILLSIATINWPYKVYSDTGIQKVKSLSLRSKLAGTVWITVPTSPYQNKNYQPSYWIPILEEIDVDGVLVDRGGEWFWWENIASSREIFKQYRDAGFLVLAHWDHHAGYGPENNPWVKAYTDRYPSKQMVKIVRVFIDTSAPPKPYRYFSNGTLVVKVGRFEDEHSVYEYYSPEEFTWLYNDTWMALKGLETDPPHFESNSTYRLVYGTHYDLIVNSTGEYLRIYRTKLANNIVYNLYILEFRDGFASLFFNDSRDVWLYSWELFLKNFSDVIDGVWQNNGGMHELGAHPEFIRYIERKYGIDFNFDNWCHLWWLPVWNTTSRSQYLLDHERYLLFKKYAKEKAELTHKYGLFWGVSSSDLKNGVRYMVEYIDFIEVNEIPGEAGNVHMFGDSWADTSWSPGNASLGTMTTSLVESSYTVDDILAYKRSALYGIRFNPDGAMMLWWTGTAGFNLKAEWVPALREVSDYWHSLFGKIRGIINMDVERYIITGIYRVSYINRWAKGQWVNYGQVYTYPLDLHYLTYVGVPRDGLGILLDQTYNGVPGSSTPYINLDASPFFEKLRDYVSSGGRVAISHSFYKHIKAGKAAGYNRIDAIVRELVNANEDVEPRGWGEWPVTKSKHYLVEHLTDGDSFAYEGRWALSWQYGVKGNNYILVQNAVSVGRNISLLHEHTYGKGLSIAVGWYAEPFMSPATSPEAYEEYSTRFVLYLSNKMNAPRVHNVGRTYVWRKNNVYYAMLIDAWPTGTPREASVVVYNMPEAVIIDCDTWSMIPNGSKVQISAENYRVIAIVSGGQPSVLFRNSTALSYTFQEVEEKMSLYLEPNDGTNFIAVYWPYPSARWYRGDNNEVLQRFYDMQSFEQNSNGVYYVNSSGVWLIKVRANQSLSIVGQAPSSETRYLLRVSSSPISTLVNYSGTFSGSSYTPFNLSSNLPFYVKLVAQQNIVIGWYAYRLVGWRLDGILLNITSLEVSIDDARSERLAEALYSFFQVSYPISILEVETLDENGDPKNVFRPLELILVKIRISYSEGDTSLNYLGICKVTDPEGYLVGYGILSTSIEPSSEQTFYVGVVPMSKKAGTYAITVYIWSDWPSRGGIPLALSKEISFQVKP